MKPIVFLFALLASATTLAHTPVCRCALNGQQIDCEAGFHDGSKAVGVTMRVMAYDGDTLATGELDTTSRFSTSLPGQPFYILMDVGPGEVFEVDWRDIDGIASDLFDNALSSEPRYRREVNSP